jgi:CheY-like chemotaxis protein/AraC-like DNA-binding protein
MFTGLPMRHVLLAVDDDPGMRDSYRAMFESDYELLTASDAEAALQILEQRTIDVMLLDIMMPGLNGLALLDVLKVRPVPPKVVVVSALNDARSTLTALRLGAHDYITKPFDVDELELVVRHLIVGQVPPVRHAEAPAITLPHAVVASSHIGLRASLTVALRTRCRVDAVSGIPAAVRLLARTLPDAIVVDTAPDRGGAAPDARLRVHCPSSQIVIVDCRRLHDCERGLRETLAVLAVRYPDLRPFTDPVPAVVAYVAEHFAHVRVTTAAEDIGLSSRQLGRVFVEQMGMAVKDYVTRVRIEAAKYLLRETSEKLEVLAEMVGLCDASHLARIFRLAGEYTPGSYRR